MGNIRYQRTAHRITSAVNCRPLKPSPRSICPAAPYPTGGHIPGIPPPAKFATGPSVQLSMRPSGPGGVEAMDPVTQRLAVHAPDLRRRASVHAVLDRGQRQKPPALVGILR